MKCGLMIWMTGVALLVFSATACIHPPGVGLFFPDESDVRDWNDESLEAGKWYYRSLEKTTCANGESAGIGMNVGDDDTDLVIYLSGGGACWDDASCRYFRTAANLDVSYDAGKLGEELYPLVEAGLFDRDHDVNPWPTASYVYVPYCTADLHTGRNMTAYDGFGGGELVHHQGAENLEYILEQLPEAFPDVERVWLVGISAGGYGVTWNFGLFRQAFPDTEMHVFNDASPWLEIEEERWTQWRDKWRPSIPDFCPQCETQPDRLPQELSRAYPETRFALSVFQRDPVLSAYLGVLPGNVEASIDDFIEERFSAENNRAFVGTGANHEALLMLDDGVQSRDDQELGNFLQQWVEGW